MSELLVDTFAEADLPDFIALSQREYGTSVSTDRGHLRWKHLSSPFGPSRHVKLVEAGILAGRCMVQPRPLLTRSGTIQAASVMDLLIDRDHRTSPGNFIKLTKVVGEVENVGLIFHTSNERTFPLYSKLFRFPMPFKLRPYGFPVRLASALKRILGRKVLVLDWLLAPMHWILRAASAAMTTLSRLDVSRRSMTDDELDALSTDCLLRSGPHLARSNAYLKWRFEEAPLWPADVYRVDCTGQFQGYVVIRKVVLDSLTHLVILDSLLNTKMGLLARIALRLWLIRQAVTSGSDSLFTLSNTESAVGKVCAGFPLLPIPETFLPHSTPIFVRVRDAQYKHLEQTSAVHVTLGDLDYF